MGGEKNFGCDGALRKRRCESGNFTRRRHVRNFLRPCQPRLCEIDGSQGKRNGAGENEGNKKCTHYIKLLVRYVHLYPRANDRLLHYRVNLFPRNDELINLHDETN